MRTPTRFRGAYKSREAAIAAIPRATLAGYNHEAVAEVSFEKMCAVAPWDYPVMFWLERLLRQSSRVLDAGGHMGTKYRAFRNHLQLDEKQVEWIIYDLPAIVKVGRERALKDGLSGLRFIDTLEEEPAMDIALISGLLQYLDVPFARLIGQLLARPSHILVNKVAMREDEPLFTLENFGVALVPYHIRNRDAFLSEIDEMGYEIRDEW